MKNQLIQADTFIIVDDMQVLYSEECAPYLQRFYVENSMGVSLPRVTFDLRIIDADTVKLHHTIVFPCC